jgi:transcription elongation factor Elf1
MEKVIKEVVCLNCGEKQELKKDEIYQDIWGKFIICKSCDSSFDVEV